MIYRGTCRYIADTEANPCWTNMTMVSWKHNQLIYLNIVECRSNFNHQDLENWFVSGFRHSLLLALVSQKGERMQGDASFNPGVSEDPEITWNDSYSYSSTLNRANRPWRGRRASLTPDKFRGMYLADVSLVDVGRSSLLPMCSWPRQLEELDKTFLFSLGSTCAKAHRYDLKEPHAFAQFLQDADIRLIRAKFDPQSLQHAQYFQYNDTTYIEATGSA